MAEQQAQTQQPQAEEKKEGLFNKLAELLGVSGEPQPTGPNVLTGLDIKNLIAHVFGDKPRAPVEEETLLTIDSTVKLVEALSRRFVDIYISDGLDRVMHPVYSAPVIDARLGELTMLLRQAIRQSWRDAVNAIRQNRPPEEVAKKLQIAEFITRLSFLLMVDLYIKLITIFYINAPAKARPPIANVALGYELLK